MPKKPLEAANEPKPAAPEKPKRSAEDQKKAVMWRPEEYNLTHESYRICHLSPLRRKGFGSPLKEFELDILGKRGDGGD